MKTAVVTGASSGIGAALSKNLLQKGWNLVVCSENETELDQVHNGFKIAFPKLQIESICLDLSIMENCEQLYAFAYSKFQSIDLLVNNAGFGTYGNFNVTDIDRMLNMVDLNVKALSKITHLFLDKMIKVDMGQIINIASIASFQPTPRMAAYGATKSYVYNFSRALNYEMKKLKSQVRIKAVCPNPVNTNFAKSAGAFGAKLFDSWLVITTNDVVNAIMKVMKSNKDYIIPARRFHVLNYITSRMPKNLTMWIGDQAMGTD